MWLLHLSKPTWNFAVWLHMATTNKGINKKNQHTEVVMNIDWIYNHLHTSADFKSAVAGTGEKVGWSLLSINSTWLLQCQFTLPGPAECRTGCLDKRWPSRLSCQGVGATAQKHAAAGEPVPKSWLRPPVDSPQGFQTGIIKHNSSWHNIPQDGHVGAQAFAFSSDQTAKVTTPRLPACHRDYIHPLPGIRISGKACCSELFSLKAHRCDVKMEKCWETNLSHYPPTLGRPGASHFSPAPPPPLLRQIPPLIHSHRPGGIDCRREQCGVGTSASPDNRLPPPDPLDPRSRSLCHGTPPLPAR